MKKTLKTLLVLAVSLFAVLTVSAGSPVGAAPYDEPGTAGSGLRNTNCYAIVGNTMYLLGSIDAEEIINYNGKDNITVIVAMDSTLPSSCSEMFANYNNLESISLDLADKSKITDMSGMFSGCTKLKTLSWDSAQANTTSFVTDMSNLFKNCVSLDDDGLDLSEFNTKNVTDMSYMFAGCTAFKELDLSNFDTSKVTNMEGMFSRCEGLEQISFGGSFDTSKVTNMEGMFEHCVALETLDVRPFKTSKVTNMAGMFSYCEGLEQISFGGSFYTSAVTNMDRMFMNCSGLTELDLETFDTRNVESFLSTFDQCSGLTVLNVKSFYPSKAETFERMFAGCSSLTSLEMSGFSAASATSARSMFEGCSGLKTLDLSAFITDDLTDMSGMFKDCTSLTELDISGIKIGSGTVVSDMFSNLVSLETLKTGGIYDNITEDMALPNDSYGKTGWCLEDEPSTNVSGTGTYANIYTSLAHDVYHKFIALDGEVTVTGEGKCGGTLTASADLNYGKSLSYEWFRDGVKISSAPSLNTYTLVGDDVGRTVKCAVSSNNGWVSGKTEGTFDGEIKKADAPAAPAGLTASAPSASGADDGKINGVTAAMEYATKQDFSDAKPCTSTQITGLASGTYYVRIAETDGTLAGAAAEVTVPLTFTVDGINALGYTGSALTPAVTVRDGTKLLTQNTDYTVAYSDNLNATTSSQKAKVTVTGLGDYYGFTLVKEFDISPIPVTLRANGATATYDGSEHTVQGYTCLRGGQKIDGLTFEGVSASCSETDADTYEVTFSGVTLGQTRDATGNYVVTGTENGLLTIVPKPIAYAGETNISFTYNGKAQQKTFMMGGRELELGDDLTVVIKDGDDRTVPEMKNAGTYHETFTGKGNYYGEWSLTVTIGKAALTVTADSAEKTYDGTALTAAGYTSAGLMEGDRIQSVTVTGTRTGYGTGANVPSAAVIKNADNEDVTANYEITFVNGTLKVNKKAVTVTADSAERPYDGTALTAAGYTSTPLAEGDGIESVTVTGTQTGAGSSANVPSAAVIKNAADEDVTANYEITYVNGTLTVSKKAVTVKADDKEKTIGTGDPELTATVTGFIGEDTVAYTLSREAGEAVGDYTITPSGNGELENYTVTYLPGRLTIEEIPTYDVTVVGGEGDGSFTQGEWVTVEADDPAPGFVFERWTGDVDFDDETSPAATFEMPARDITVTAVFRDAAPDERFDDVDVRRGGSLEAFKVTAAYTEGAFSDAAGDAWYAESLKTAVEYGILKGKGDGTFGIGQPMKLCEALAIAARLHNLYYGGSGRFDQTKDEHWYTVYVDYAVKYGILTDGSFDPTATATRAQFALLLSAALPDGALEPVNRLTSLPDVAADDPRLPAILRLYNAGILNGVDDKGSFDPDAPVLREHSAAIVARVTVPALRKMIAQ